mmetsp:Transcript_9103/g.13702  ORF Transcript_9103/g.13702 Transcript_9103/m.13702 type:complete len:613 (+) Transcript_9103:30-1868(+)
MKTSLIEPARDTGKFGNPRCRFTIFYAFVIFLLATSPLWLSVIIPHQVVWYNTVVILAFSALWLCIGFNALINYSKLNSIPLPPIEAIQASRSRKFLHVVIVPCYLDPIDVLFDCIGSLLMQCNTESLLVVVAFEVKTPDLTPKVESVRTAFAKLFGHFLITTHTVDKSCEIAGGCSNKNYALREAYKYISECGLDKDTSITLTTCDTDSLFHPNHFSVLESVYNASNPVIGAPPRMCVWQPPLFYNWDLDQRPFFNRVTGLMRSMMMLGGLISFNLNPMSIFSYPMELGLKSGFINPRYGVDDIIAKVRWMCSTNEQVPVLLLPVPAISGPTIGTSFYSEVQEWSRQIRRWIVGSSESFHYFVIHYRGEPLLSGISWFFMFFIYYAVLLCSAGIFTLLAGIPLPWVHYPVINLGIGMSFSLRNIGLVGLILQYLAFGIAFVIDSMAVRMMTIKEEISLARNIAHWISAPFVLLVYSIIAFYAIMKFVVVGKKMARHDMAAKEGLGANTVATVSGANSEQPNSIKEPEEVEYDDDVLPSSYRSRSRSTSVSLDAQIQPPCVIPNGVSKAEMTPAQPAIPPQPLLCKIPAHFRFGEYVVNVKEIVASKSQLSA